MSAATSRRGTKSRLAAGVLHRGRCSLYNDDVPRSRLHRYIPDPFAIADADAVCATGAGAVKGADMTMCIALGAA